MKMNKKLRTILNAAVATSLFAFAACSDYLEDFQDKYDDGNAFAEISSDSDNGGDDGSSDSKLSSSNGGDSELSSSSKGNGDVESSDSTDSSSSATDPGSSSSVTESSSSAFEPCTGTVIYDAEEDLEHNRFGRKFITFVQEYGSDWSKTSPDGVTAQLSKGSSLIMPLATYPDTMNIEPWGGFCVEYTGSGDLHANVVDESSGNKYILLYKEMPNINGEKSSFRWSWDENEGLMELMEEQKNSVFSNGFSIEKVNSINFTSYSGNSSITIHKITTLIPNVSIDENLKCDGSTFTPLHIEYWSSLGLQEKTNLKPGSEYKITLLGNNTVLVNHMDDQVTLAQAKGFCIEYSSDKNFLLSFHRYEGTLTNDSANVSIYKGEKKISYILWQDLERRFGSFHSTNIHLLTFSAKQTENDTTNILISRMTLIE